MVPSPVETWERLLVWEQLISRTRDIPLPSPDSTIRRIAETCTGNRGTVFPKNPSTSRWVTLSEMMEVKPTLNEGPCSLERIFVVHYDGCFYLWFWTFFENKSFQKTRFQKMGFFSLWNLLEDHLCLRTKLSYCYLLSHQFSKNKSAQKMFIYICECKMRE